MFSLGTIQITLFGFTIFTRKDLIKEITTHQRGLLLKLENNYSRPNLTISFYINKHRPRGTILNLEVYLPWVIEQFFIWYSWSTISKKITVLKSQIPPWCYPDLRSWFDFSHKQPEYSSSVQTPQFLPPRRLSQLDSQNGFQQLKTKI